MKVRLLPPLMAAKPEYPASEEIHPSEHPQFNKGFHVIAFERPPRRRCYHGFSGIAIPFCLFVSK
jgi:hypothetical protein